MAERTQLGVTLKRYRVASGLSQEALAERAGLSARAISDLERGLHRAPHPSTTDLLAQALALNPQQRAILFAAARPETHGAIDIKPDSAPEHHPCRIPQPLTGLIARHREHEQALQLLGASHCRLLTLTGPGGVGKTRLAIAIAHDLAATFADGAVFVDLAMTRDESRLPSAIAEALGLRDRQDFRLSDQLHDYLYDKRMLLLLDNFEHLLMQAPIVAGILVHCPNIVILTTSRAALRVRGEHVLTVGPLPLDMAVALFNERAYDGQPQSGATRELVEAICERVDCLPLGIELAVAQTQAATPRQTLDLLTHRLALLRGGARDLPRRQQTMEDAIAWSYDLLDEDQKRTFRALAVFAGGWTLEAALAVCWEEGEVDAPGALLALAALVDASLVLTESTSDGAVRFRMLELTREYAIARLEAHGEERQCRLRHASYFAHIADSIGHFGPGQRPHFADPAPELHNARVALAWAEAAEQSALGLRLCGFGRLMLVHGQAREAIEWQERMLAVDQRVRTRDVDAAPLRLRAERMHGLARTLLMFGDLRRAETIAHEALQLSEESGDDYTISDAAATVGMVARSIGKIDEAIAAFTYAREHTPVVDEGGLRFRIEALWADAEGDRGNLQGAARLLESALAGAEKNGNTWDMARILARLGLVACLRKQYDASTRYFTASLTLFRSFDSPGFTASCLEGYAGTLSATEQHTEAVEICAASTTLRERAHMPASAVEQKALAQILAAAQSALNFATYRQAWDAGAALTSGDAIARALTFATQHFAPETQPNGMRRIFAI